MYYKLLEWLSVIKTKKKILDYGIILSITVYISFILFYLVPFVISQDCEILPPQGRTQMVLDDDNGGYISLRKTAGDGELYIGKNTLFSNSMVPVMGPGHKLLLSRDVSDIKIGDIIVYRSDGMNVVHRLVSISGVEYTCKGDNNKQTDEPIKKDMIEAVVVAVSY